MRTTLIVLAGMLCLASFALVAPPASAKDSIACVGPGAGCPGWVVCVGPHYDTEGHLNCDYGVVYESP